jgi:hypothetical protein
MPFALEQLSEGLSVPAAELDPVSQAAGAVTTGGVDMSRFQRVMFLLMVGSVGASGTVDAKLQDSNDNSTFADLSPGVSITQVTASNKIVTVEIRADQCRRYVRLSVTVGTNAVLIAAVPLAGEAVYKPAKAKDIAAVAQRKVA